uniref:UBA domain-containing protein n=1 Tax=Attheya septentrionalis TaxID=420275 RepID=A0A7S2UJ74_9STRA|mmetsp:Transcript_24797/g.44906  ORF Transcript_24797/g.44906 Transcript_24797/m.44906 type:complete len:314 (+) Transcript_24797:99-1040(+)
MMEEDDASIAMLMSMGFPASQASEALRATDGDMDRAVNYILTGSVSSSASPPSNGSSRSSPNRNTTNSISPSRNNKDSSMVLGTLEPIMINCDASQYTIQNGRSACTCIALAGANAFLSEMSKPDPDPFEIITPAFLQRVLARGVWVYHQLMQKEASTGNSEKSNVEHKSAEEVLLAVPDTTFGSMTAQGRTVVQGIIDDDMFHPMGFRRKLASLRDDMAKTVRSSWMAVVITKTPETVVVCLSDNDECLLLDSHPRPELQATGSYAMMHADLDSLCLTLFKLFPPVHMTSDISETMAMMYNSFDLYPFQQRT